MNNSFLHNIIRGPFSSYVFTWLFVIIVSFNLNSQSVEFNACCPDIMDSLHFYQQYDQPLEVYAAQFKKLRYHLLENDSLELYKKCVVYLNWMVQHPRADSAFIRKQYAYYGNGFEKEFGDIENTIKYNEIAHKFGGNLEHASYIWNIENSLGVKYNMIGDHEKSQYYYRMVIAEFDRRIKDPKIELSEKKKNIIYRLRAKNNLAYLFLWNESYDEAINLLKNAIVEFKDITYPLGLSFTYGYLAETYKKLNDLDSLQKFTSLLGEIIPKLDLGKQFEKELLYHELLGDIAAMEANYHQANHEYLNVIRKKKIHDENHRSRSFAKIYNKIAQSYIALGNLDSADIMVENGLFALYIELNQVLKSDIYLYNENTIAELLETNADVNLSKFKRTGIVKYLDAAFISFNQALKVLMFLRDDYILSGSKLLSIAENRKLVEKSIDILYQKQGILGRDEILIQDVEKLFGQSKNLLLSEVQNDRLLIEELSDSIKLEIKNHQRAISALILNGRQVSENKSKTLFSSELLTLQSKIKGLIGNKSIEADAILTEPYIEFLLGEKYLYSIDNISGEKRFLRLSERKEIVRLIEHSQLGILQKDNSDHFFKIQSELFNKLFGHIENLPAEFTILSDDMLCFVAYPALIKNLNTKRFLIEDHIVKTHFNRSRVNNGQLNKGNHLVAIAPDYPKSHIEQTRERGEIYYLPFAKEEVNTILNIWNGPSTNYSGLSKAEFFNSFTEASTVHYAGHALVNDDEGYLALGPDSSSWVGMDEIAKSPFHANTVILSACETGLGKLQYGEGVSSLAKSFLYSGTQSIIYSLWTINDQTTSKLMKSFYTNQNEGASLAASFTEAQREHLKQYKDKYAHPYYWAAFVVVDGGGYSKTFELNNLQLLLIIVFLALLIIIFIRITKPKQNEKSVKN